MAAEPLPHCNNDAGEDYFMCMCPYPLLNRVSAYTLFT